MLLFLLDSLGVATPDTTLVRELFNTFLGWAPWLDEKVVRYASVALASLPVVGSVMSVEFVKILLAKGSPYIRAFVFGKLERWKGLINIALAFAFGLLWFQDPAMGLAAGGVWGIGDSIVKAITNGKSVNAVVKAKVMGALLVLGLLVTVGDARDASADGAPLKWNQRFAFSAGTGFEIETPVDSWEPEGDWKPAVAGRLGYLLPVGGGKTNSAGWAASIVLQVKRVQDRPGEYSAFIWVAP